MQVLNRKIVHKLEKEIKDI